MRKFLFIPGVVLFLSLGRAEGQGEKPPLKPLDRSYLSKHAQTGGFMRGRPVKPQPTPDGQAVLFLRSGPGSSRLSLFEFEVASGRTRELLTPEKLLKGAEEKLTPEEKARRERMRVSGAGFTSYQLSSDGKKILLGLSGRLYLFDRVNDSVLELNTGPGVLDPKFAPDGKWISYVRDYDLYVIDPTTQKERPITRGGSEFVTHALAEFVAQEEMNRHTGYWWAPDGQSLLYQESDARGVEVWHVADPIYPEQKPTSFFYPRPGKANVKVRLGLISLAGGDTTWIDWDREKYPYLTQVQWSRHGPPTLSVQNRDQTELVLLQADPKTGKTRVLLSERDPAWVNIRQDVPFWLPDKKGFLWVSETAGGPRLEGRDLTGKLLDVLVEPEAGLQSLLGVETLNSDRFYFQASGDPTQSRYYMKWLNSPKKKGLPLLDEPGPVRQSAQWMAAKNQPIFVVTQTTPHEMPRSFVRTLYEKVGELPSVAEHPGFVPRVQFVKVGKMDFHAAVVHPQDFDPAKKYPVIVDVYGGPLHNHVLVDMRRWLLAQWYADQGFIVVAIDGRGTPGRGRDWERAITRKFASIPLDDQAAGLKELGNRFKEMDLKRVGISGWSFGGYMSALAVLRRPDVFHAASAGAPVVDWLDYDTHYTERYLGIPPRDQAAYKENSLLDDAAKLRRPLLLIHGTADDNVYFRHSLKLADALFRAGKDFDLLPLPGLTHMVPDPEVMEQLHLRIVRFFQKNLGGKD